MVGFSYGNVKWIRDPDGSWFPFQRWFVKINCRKPQSGFGKIFMSVCQGGQLTTGLPPERQQLATEHAPSPGLTPSLPDRRWIEHYTPPPPSTLPTVQKVVFDYFSNFYEFIILTNFKIILLNAVSFLFDTLAKDLLISVLEFVFFCS